MARFVDEFRRFRLGGDEAKLWQWHIAGCEFAEDRRIGPDERLGILRRMVRSGVIKIRVPVGQRRVA